MPNRSLLAIICAGSAVAASPCAFAEPQEEAPVSQPAQGPFQGVAAVDGSALRSVSGMANLQQYANANNTSVVSGNSVNGESVTGQIAIDGQSFQNMHGLSILTANTGNNVSINAAMNVNVSIQQ